jgi:EmrB/QacA subfamily drug resistance transporter
LALKHYYSAVIYMSNETKSHPDKTSALITVCLGSFLSAFMIGAVNVALPQIGNEFNMDAILIGWVSTGYILASVIFVLPFGRIADIIGRKKIFVWGMIIFTAMSFFLAVANSIFMLIVFRFLQGAGVALIICTNVAILSSVIPSGERGRALGLYAASVYLGLSLGPFLGGLLTHYFGWRSVFIVCVPVGLFIIALILRRLTGEWADAKGEKFDIVGSIIFSLMLVAITYGITVLPEMLGLILIALGIIGFAIFVIWETKIEYPVLNIRIFYENKAFLMSCLAALINYGATWAVSFLLSLYLQYIKGLNPQDAGFILVSQPVMLVLFSPLIGRISDRVEPRIVASAGMALTVVGLFLFVFLTKETTVPVIIGSLALLGLGSALFISPNTNAAMSAIEKRYYGVASASIATARQLGMIGSMGIVMLLFTLYVGRVQITPESHGLFLQSYQMAFITFTILCFAGIFASLTRGKIRESKNQNF